MSSPAYPGRTLISRQRIRRQVKQLGCQIAADYSDMDLVLVAVLKGAVCFLADLMREIPASVELEFAAVSSYRGVESGELSLKKPIGADLFGRHVLPVEDIVDSGATARFLVTPWSPKGNRWEPDRWRSESRQVGTGQAGGPTTPRPHQVRLMPGAPRVRGRLRSGPGRAVPKPAAHRVIAQGKRPDA
jgi:hypothetical protein